MQNEEKVPSPPPTKLQVPNFERLIGALENKELNLPLDSLSRRKRTREEIEPHEEDEDDNGVSEFIPEENISTEDEVARFLPPDVPKRFAARILDAEAVMYNMIKTMQATGMVDDLQALIEYRSQLRTSLYMTTSLLGGLVSKTPSIQ